MHVLLAAADAASKSDSGAALGVQILLVIVTAMGTLGVTLLVQLFTNRQQYAAVRAQIIATLMDCASTAQVAYQNKDITAFKSLHTPIEMLSQRLSDKDVALSFNLKNLRRLIRVQSLCWFYTEGFERLQESLESGQNIDKRRGEYQGIARLLHNAIYEALVSMRVSIAKLPPWPGHVPKPTAEQIANGNLQL